MGQSLVVVVMVAQAHMMAFHIRHLLLDRLVDVPSQRP
jgi:hypothetical protein